MFKLSYIYILTIVILHNSCQSSDKKIKIQFTPNGKKYEIIENDRSLKCEITYDTFSTSKNNLNSIDRLRHKRLTFFYQSNPTKDKQADSIILYSWMIVLNELKKDNNIIFENYDNEYAGYESVFKSENEISARYVHEIGTKDKFHLYISIDGNYAKGTFSGELTSDFDSTLVTISNGNFENVPFKKNSLNYLQE